MIHVNLSDKILNLCVLSFLCFLILFQGLLKDNLCELTQLDLFGFFGLKFKQNTLNVDK